MVQLTGLGGIGKSLLAIEYAKRFGAAYPGGIHCYAPWVRSPEADGLRAQQRERQRQIEDLAVLHDIPIRDKELREVRRDLGKKLARRALSVDRGRLAAGTGPDTRLSRLVCPQWQWAYAHHHALQGIRGLGMTVEIDVLDPAAALELLTQKRKPQTKQERQDAQGLSDDLGRHALALDVGGHFLLEDKGFAALRAELASVQSDLLGEISAGPRRTASGRT